MFYGVVYKVKSCSFPKNLLTDCTGNVVLLPLLRAFFSVFNFPMSVGYTEHTFEINCVTCNTVHSVTFITA